MNMKKNVRRRVLTFLMISLIFSWIFPGSLTADAYAFTPPFTIKSESGIVLNLDSDTVVYEKNADRQEMPAHLVQIMTAIIVLENCSNIDHTSITMSVNPYTLFQGYSELDDVRYAGIEAGDSLTVAEYLYAMLLTSSCESAYILANYIGNGSMDTFVGMMNNKAADIGCTGTHFTNATGLYDAYQITTARDMMLITQYALNHVSRFREIATAESYATMSKSSDTQSAMSGWSWDHSNTMTDPDSASYYEGAKGIKTGNLNRYGRNIVTMATRDGMTYLVVLLGAPFEDEEGELQYYHLEDAANLLDWAFSSFQYTTLLGSDEEIAELPVSDSNGNDFVLVKPKETLSILWCTDVDVSAIQRVPTYNENISAPIHKGDVLGQLDLKFSGEVIASVELVAVSNVERSAVKYNANAFITYFTDSGIGSTFHVSLIFACILSAAYIILCIYSAYAARQKQKAMDAVHVVPRGTSSDTQPPQKKAWKRSDPVFYHKPSDDQK